MVIKKSICIAPIELHLIVRIFGGFFLVLGKDPTFDINESSGSVEKNVGINFSKVKTQFLLILHYNADNSFLFVNGKEIFKFKADNKNVSFLAQFCLGSMSNGFIATQSREVS